MFVEQNCINAAYQHVATCATLYLRCKEWAGNAYDACAETVGACGTFSQRAEHWTIYTHTVTLTACRSTDSERLDLLDALCRLHLLRIGAFMY